MKPQLLIGGLNSGSGKTTFTMGFLRVLRKQGLQVQPYKCGPDYIDTQFHSLATGHQSVNLDTWLASEEHVKHIYAKYGKNADACITEGVMGVFDGYSRMKGSSAEIAMLLDIPVVLVVNARSTAYTVASQIYGVKQFCPQMKLAGVVFNQVSSPNHYAFLKDACMDAGVECFGYLPKSDGLEIPSRHLGLTLGVKEQMDEQIEMSAGLVEAFVDVGRILERCSCELKESPCLKAKKQAGLLKIAVAMDEAFNFVYRENIERLKQMGSVTFFSPLKGEALPEANLIYLPGGYPELFASRLQKHRRLMNDLRKYAENGGKMLAECGGMMYLTRVLNGKRNRRYSFCGVLPLECTMENARLHLGYREVVDMRGNHWRGHEFHYSDVVGTEALPSVARQYNAQGKEVNTPLYRYKNVIAGYTHLYWGETDILKLWE